MQTTKQLAMRISLAQDEITIKKIMAIEPSLVPVNESNDKFLSRLMKAGILTGWAPEKGLPYFLYYLNKRPLIGFLPPDIDEQLSHTGTIIKTKINVVKTVMMPEFGDMYYAKALILAFALSKALDASCPT